MVHRRDRFRSEKILSDKLEQKAVNGNVRIHWNSVLEEVLGDDGGVTGMRIRNMQNGGTHDIDLHGVFIAIGHEPNTKLFQDQLEMRHGYIVVNSGIEGNATATSVPGVFAAGAVAASVYRQATGRQRLQPRSMPSAIRRLGGAEPVTVMRSSIDGAMNGRRAERGALPVSVSTVRSAAALWMVSGSASRWSRTSAVTVC